ncbi:MAG: hypothetical protein NTW29_13115 [Bacteroidetes bacterium]|nr:hypothetical protein [Bacteroidota bacterium]
MKYVALLLILVIANTGQAQNFINKRASQVINMLNKYDAGPGYEKPVITTGDSIITMRVKGSGKIETVFIYLFDSEGRCKSEQIKASCDSCYKKYLDGVLAQKKYQWKKINENQYISSFGKKRMIEMPAENNDFSYMILRTGWSKKLYQLLTGN